MLLMVKVPSDLATAIEKCRKGEAKTQTGLNKGAHGNFVVVQQGTAKKSRYAEFAEKGNEVLNIFEGDKPWGVVINKAIFKYVDFNKSAGN